MQRLIVKTAVKTVLILLGIIIVVFAVFNVAFPQHMATAMETLGNYDMAVKYANLRYVYTNDSEDLARCYDDSVLSEDDGSIIYYAEKLIAANDYSKLCAARNAKYNGLYIDQLGFNFDYDLRVRSSLALSYYSQSLDLKGAERLSYSNKAVDYAFEANGDNRFPYGNPLMLLSLKVANAKDSECAFALNQKLELITPTLDEDVENLEYFKIKLRGVIS